MMVKKIKFLKSLFYTLRQFLFETKKGSIVLIAIGILGLLVVISCDYQDYASNEVMEKTYTHYPEEKIKAEYFEVDFLDFMDEQKS